MGGVAGGGTPQVSTLLEKWDKNTNAFINLVDTVIQSDLQLEVLLGWCLGGPVGLKSLEKKIFCRNDGITTLLILKSPCNLPFRNKYRHKSESANYSLQLKQSAYRDLNKLLDQGNTAPTRWVIS